MHTRTVSAIEDENRLVEPAIMEAVRLLQADDIVAIPTETVYGLAANALSEKAVAKIYEAKGRPSHNPLIVHVASVKQAQDLIADWPAEAQLLAEAFWPGPLTLVLKKRWDVVPDITTAGGNTVAVRCPSHPVALEVIKRCGFPLAAPSANPSNAISPTLAEHVASSLNGKIPLILDGGPCEAGIESTVLNLTGDRPAILRPGILSAHFLSEVLERKVESTHAMPRQVAGEGSADSNCQASLSPGQLLTHYSPRTPLYLVSSGDLELAQRKFTSHFSSMATVKLGQELQIGNDVIMPDDPAGYANSLYLVLHQLDLRKLDAILLEMPADEQAWDGIRDRLLRAGILWTSAKV